MTDEPTDLPRIVPVPAAETRSLATLRAHKLRVALADALGDLADELRDASPTDAPRVLRALALTSAQGHGVLAALDGVDLPRKRQRGTSDSEATDPMDDTVESATGQGGYGGLAGTAGQIAENHGQRVINEVVALARAYMEKQSRPKLGELIGARLDCLQAGDLAGATVIAEKMKAWYNIETDVSKSLTPFDFPPPPPAGDTAASTPNTGIDADFEEA